MSDNDQFIERRIIIGLIVSTDYIREVEPIWNPALIESATARLIASWCIEYYHKYRKAPSKDIQGIFVERTKTDRMSKEQVKQIEGILENLSEEYDRKQFNVEYLLDQTKEYLRERNIEYVMDQVKGELSAGQLVEAEHALVSYKPVVKESHGTIDPFSDSNKIKQAFETRADPIIYFPKALGSFWNTQLTRDSFIALMGPEKRGKTFMLMEFSLRAMQSGCNVVFFQAGDMTEDQQIRRLAIRLAGRSDKERYCQGRYMPEVDCLKNQLGTCDKDERESDFGIYTQDELDQILSDKDDGLIDYENLLMLKHDNPDYKACHNCPEMEGAPWLRWMEPVKPLNWKEAYKTMRRWQKRYRRRYKLCTYPNETLTVMEMYSLLDIWERQEDFVPDVIVIDYADILAPDPDCSRLDWRNQNNRIWQRLRRLSQEKHCLVVTATQAAASSYDKKSLRLSDFSEDKRKYAHVTAMYGLNQNDDEKKIGVMRINELVVRDDEFDRKREVKVLQCLQRGRPIIGSYM